MVNVSELSGGISRRDQSAGSVGRISKVHARAPSSSSIQMPYPARPRAYTSRTIIFWLEHILPKNSVTRFAQFHMIWNSEVLFESYLSYGLQVMSITQQETKMNNYVLFHKSACITLLNQRLRAGCFDDAVIISICTIIAVDSVAGDMSYYNIHITGLRDLVRPRGGLEYMGNFTTNRVIGAEVLGIARGSPISAADMGVFSGPQLIESFFEQLRDTALLYGIRVRPRVFGRETLAGIVDVPAQGTENAFSRPDWPYFVRVCYQFLRSWASVTAA